MSKKHVKFRDRSPFNWDDVDKLKDEILNNLIYQHSIINTMAVLYETIEDNKKPKKAGLYITGYLKSLKDLTIKLRYNMEQHMTFGYMISKDYKLEELLADVTLYDNKTGEHKKEFSNLIEKKTGKIKVTKNNLTDEQYLYINVFTFYNEIATELTELAYTPLYSILESMNLTENDINNFEATLEKIKNGEYEPKKETESTENESTETDSKEQ